MHLINILVIAVSVLTILSALALVFGSSKSERAHSLWFLVAAVAEVFWACSIAFALSLGTGEFDHAAAPWLVKGIYVGAILMDSTILGYVSWKYRYGKILTSLFLIAGAILSTIFLYDPSILYTSINLTPDGNSITINMNSWFYPAYIIYFCTIVPSFCCALIYRIKHTRSKDSKKGYLFFLIGLAAAGVLSLIFDLIIPMQRYDLIWVGPLAIGFIMLGFYYAVLRYRMVVLNTSWLKILSAIVIISSAVIAYLLIFHLVFSALFRVASPSFQVILLNFIMIAIVLALAPAISEIFALTRSLILVKQIDIAYIVKKLTAASRKKLNLKDLSGFLAEHLHFSYVGFFVNDKYYVADDNKMSTDGLKTLSSLKRPDRGIWQDLSGIIPVAKSNDIFRVAVLTNTKGNVIGQVVLGRPTNKSALDERDFAEVEIIINLMGTLIESHDRKS